MSVSDTATRPVAKPKPAPKPKAGFDRGAFYRLCRMLHAYFSAFAFLTLIFFSATGVMLNHPGWFEALTAKEKVVEVSVPAADIAKAKALPDPGPALVAATGKVTRLRGAYSSADVQGNDALLRMDGPKGTSVIELDLATGKAKVTTDKANTLLMIQDLHRGKNSGLAWRWVIDLSAYIILALSVIGYVLFFSLRFRLRTSLILTAVSLLVLVGIAVVFVP
ncbi:MAG: hypothetical protein JWM33_2900 [Caulobacteraceae bacterium]|nr:hypothetical protein [Caulobacteraceae bacterium]